MDAADFYGRISRASLTPPERELALLRCLSHGMTVAMAAETCGRGVRQARDDLERARIRLRAKSNLHTVSLAIRQGLID